MIEKWKQVAAPTPWRSMMMVIYVLDPYPYLIPVTYRLLNMYIYLNNLLLGTLPFRFFHFKKTSPSITSLQTTLKAIYIQP